MQRHRQWREAEQAFQASIVSHFFRSEMPLVYRIATSLLLKPAIWIYSRFQDEETREADKKDWGDSQAALAKYHERVDREMERIRNEPPAQSTH